MAQFHHSTVGKVSEADVVIIGVPDESRSHASRRGTSKGPDVLRLISNETELFERNRKKIPILPMRGKVDNKRILDYGNIRRKELYQLVFTIVSKKKIPIIIGGDHSITTIALKAIGNIYHK